MGRAIAGGRSLGSVGHMRCQVTLVGETTGMPRSNSQWRSTAEQAVASADDYLSEMLEGDPAIYVLRNIRVDVAATTSSPAAGEAVAQALGRCLTKAVMQQIAHDDTDQRRFADQAEYVARFLADLLGGSAWEQWYYRPFQLYRAPTTGETARRALLANRADLSTILSTLRQEGRLDALLSALGPTAAAELWTAGLKLPPDDREALRPFVTAALALADHLGLWSGPRPSPEAALANVPATWPPIDWRDRRSLAEVVLFVLAALAAKGHLGPLAGDSASEPAAAPDNLDWLDSEWLMSQLGERIAPARRPRPAAGEIGPVRAAALTPRQTRLLDDLLRLVSDKSFDWRAGADPSPATDALRLYALLTVRHPEWRGDALVTTLIDRLLASRDALIRGNEADARRSLQPLGPAAEHITRRLAGMGEPASTAALSWAGAGVALLLRALFDARLPALGRAAHAAEPESAMRALAAELLLRLSPSPTAGALPPALVALCGGFPALPDDLRQTLDALSFNNLSAAWLDTMVAFRALDTAALRLMRRTPGDGRQYIIGGDATADLWPLCAILPASASEPAVTALLEKWAAACEAAGGRRPTFTAASADLAGISGSASPPDLEPVERWPALAGGMALRPDIDLLLGLMAGGLLRLWARWLGKFAASSAPYLQAHFIHRGGTLFAGAEEITVVLEPRPLDIVLEMAGYFDPIERIPWLDGRPLRFRIAR